MYKIHWCSICKVLHWQCNSFCLHWLFRSCSALYLTVSYGLRHVMSVSTSHIIFYCTQYCTINIFVGVPVKLHMYCIYSKTREIPYGIELLDCAHLAIVAEISTLHARTATCTQPLVTTCTSFWNLASQMRHLIISVVQTWNWNGLGTDVNSVLLCLITYNYLPIMQYDWHYQNSALHSSFSDSIYSRLKHGRTKHTLGIWD